MSIVGVECNADRYFFGRLLDDKNLIRKERNDFEVIKGVSVRSKGNFSIGIIDIDKNKKIPNDFIILEENNNTKILKHSNYYQFLVLVGPRQFEHWINDFLKLTNTSVEDFDFISFDQFMEISKSISPEKHQRFKNVIDFVIKNYNNDINHISKLKQQLEYIIAKKYLFNSDEFFEL